VDGLKVSQLAERAGVPATTLRYYEQQGLLTPRRSASGYRLFDDEALDQLRFIATAKGLGLSLDDIRILLRPWQREGCREVQRTLAPMLAQRCAQAREQITALQEFTARLDDARRVLAGIDREGPCDASCTFLNRAQEAAPGRSADAGPPRPIPSPREDAGPVPSPAPATLEVPDSAGAACSLPAPSWRGRWARWSRLLVHATSRERLVDRVRVGFAPAVLENGGAGELAALVRAEQDCCPSLAMSVTIGPGVVVEVRVPDDEAAEVATSLFGPVPVSQGPATAATVATVTGGGRS